MGDRISIQFVNGNDVSVAFFSHWDGLALLDKVREYLKELKAEQMVDNLNDGGKNNYYGGPLSRMEPCTVMTDFVGWIRSRYADEDGRIRGNYYLGKDENDGDNSDNGNYLIDMVTGEIIGENQ